jgi:hypothetical protein
MGSDARILASSRALVRRPRAPAAAPRRLREEGGVGGGGKDGRDEPGGLHSLSCAPRRAAAPCGNHTTRRVVVDGRGAEAGLARLPAAGLARLPAAVLWERQPSWPAQQQHAAPSRRVCGTRARATIERQPVWLRAQTHSAGWIFSRLLRSYGRGAVARRVPLMRRTGGARAD